jgi:hypothetical protein
VPPRRTAVQAVRIVVAEPTHSSALSTPRPSVIARTCLARVGSATRKSVAPAVRARSSFVAEVSTAMIRSAPARRAPVTAESPTPPSPTTSTVSPGWAPAAFWAAPTPVRMAQPSRAASSRGTSFGRGTTAVAAQTTSSAIAPRPRQASNGEPSARWPPGAPVRPSIAEHSQGSSRVQNQQARHGTAQLRTTWSPTATVVTSAPTAVTTPAASCPSTWGYDGDRVPLTIDRSEWQTPATRTRRDPRLRQACPLDRDRPGASRGRPDRRAVGLRRCGGPLRTADGLKTPTRPGPSGATS